MGYDFDRPFIKEAAMGTYTAIDKKTASLYGGTVRAVELSNVEYKTRFNKLSSERNMKPPPGTGKIHMGVLVVRKLGTPQQYETWMPGDVFDELYRAMATPTG